MSPPPWIERLLRTPLLTKLVTIDLVVNGVAFVALQWVPADEVTWVTVASLTVIAVLNAVVVAWALQPLAALEDTARRVSAGEFTARTALSPLADRNLARIGRTFDGLLDRVEEDRRRLRALASEVVAAGDRERAHIARELHDGTAQSLSALDMLLSAGTVDAARLAQLREVVSEALAEVRALAQTVHPRVLDDLGLPSALTHLARRVREQGGPEVRVEIADAVPALPPGVAATLYRIAQEALHNATKHAQAPTVHVALEVAGDRVALTVSDAGAGFDRERARSRGMGLFVMEERVGLVGGTLRVRSAPGAGTNVRAEIPLRGEAVAPLLGGAP